MGGVGRGGKDALGMAGFSLRKMAAGGMYDHVGGGFHRYSVDEFWHVPHFEKVACPCWPAPGKPIWSPCEAWAWQRMLKPPKSEQGCLACTGLASYRKCP